MGGGYFFNQNQNIVKLKNYRFCQGNTPEETLNDCLKRSVTNVGTSKVWP